MTDDLLTTFRSEIPVPDEDTTQRIYERATSGRRNLVTRRSLVAVVAVLAAAGIAAGLSLTLGGSSKTTTGPHPGGPNPGGLGHPGGPGGGMALAPVTMEVNLSKGEVSSLDVTVRSVHPDTTLDVKVVRSDASQPADADTAPNEVVFSEQESPTVTDTTMQDATHATWSGTLTPSDWSGGCQDGLYRVEYSFGPDADSGSTDWFRCTGY